MIRKAAKTDLEAVVRIYEEIIAEEEKGNCCIGWVRGIYPTRETAEAALQNGSLYVLEADGVVVASARIDHEQPPAYATVPWHQQLPPEKVLVLHTLTVSPAAAGHGHARTIMSFYEAMAREQGCCMRIDTNVKNSAQHFYFKLGYAPRGVIPCEFNGIRGVNLLCMEKCPE